MKTNRVIETGLRIAAIVVAVFLVYMLFEGSGVDGRERTIFWISVAGLGVAIGIAWQSGKRTPYWIASSAVIGVVVVAFVATIAIFRDPPLLRFGHALAISLGNAVTLGLATWLGAAAGLQGRRPKSELRADVN